MANVIKHKRGSGSDPGASDLILGELAIRTDTGKLFTKMDSGAIAEIAGGGSDIAINTLSSSSGTGGGSATFNGSAYRFTLSAPPNVSAAQLLVSINGVIQKPVAGTGQPSEGFSVDGTDIILGDAPATGSDFFILTFKSLGVSEPADNSVTSAKIVDGAIVNADINASAAIAGTKISPDFGSQTISTTGALGVSGVSNLSGELRANGNIRITNAGPKITLVDSNNDDDFEIVNNNGVFTIKDSTDSVDRLAIDSSGNVGIGTTSPAALLNLNVDTEANLGSGSEGIRLTSGSSNAQFVRLGSSYSNNSVTGPGALLYSSNKLSLRCDNGNPITFHTGSTVAERMRIDSSGNVGIGTTSPITKLNVNSGTTDLAAQLVSSDTNVFLAFKDGDASGNQQVQIGGEGNNLVAYAGGSERMRIDSSGRVGIGCTPTAQFDHNLIQIGNQATLGANAALSTTGQTFLTHNLYYDTGGTLQVFNTSNANQGAIIQIREGYFAFSNSPQTTGTPTVTERMRIDSSGRIGIGTTSPSSKLHINCGSDNTAVQINSTDAGSFYQAIDNTGESIFGHSGANAIISVDPGASVSSSAIVFQVDGNSEKMRIDSSGNVGIGGTAPNYQLHVVNGIGVGSHGFAQQLSITNNKIQSLLLGTGYTNMTINALGGLVGIGTGTTSLAARLHVENGGSGNVAFLKHASSGIAVTLKLQNNRATGTLAGEQISFTDDTGTQRGKITNTTATTTYHTSSDYRLKENEVLISDGIERIKQLKPYKFSWKHIPNKIVDGFFAHEVENLVEDCVDGTKDRVVTKDDHDKGDYLDKEIGTEIHQMMDHSKLVPLIVAALQEAIGRIEVLEAK